MKEMQTEENEFVVLVDEEELREAVRKEVQKDPMSSKYTPLYVRWDDEAAEEQDEVEGQIVKMQTNEHQPGMTRTKIQSLFQRGFTGLDEGRLRTDFNDFDTDDWENFRRQAVEELVDRNMAEYDGYVGYLPCSFKLE